MKATILIFTTSLFKRNSYFGKFQINLMDLCKFMHTHTHFICLLTASAVDPFHLQIPGELALTTTN